MKQLTNDSSLQRIDLNPCSTWICLSVHGLSRFLRREVFKNNQSTVRFSSPRPIQESSFFSQLLIREWGASFSASLISIANQPRRICSLKRWSIDSASLRPYLAACSARDWLLRRWRCIIKIKIGYCPGSIVEAPLEIGRKPDTGSSANFDLDSASS